MKRPDFKCDKWDMKKNNIIENNYYEAKLQEIYELEQKFKNNSCDEISYCISIAVKYQILLNYNYILDIEDKKNDLLKNIYEKIKKAYFLYDSGEKTARYIEPILKKGKNRELAAYYAIAANDFISAKKILKNESILFKVLDEEYNIAIRLCKNENIKNNTINKIIISICTKDEDELRKLTYKRINEIRKQAQENMIIIDIWLTALLKIAKKLGLDIDDDFIEIPKYIMEL